MLSKLQDFDKDDIMQKLVLTETVKQEYIEQKKLLADNLHTVYAVAWGQCSDMIQAKVRAATGFKEKDKACDCIWLLHMIQAITYKYNNDMDWFVSWCKARLELETKTQQKTKKW